MSIISLSLLVGMYCYKIKLSIQIWPETISYCNPTDHHFSEKWVNETVSHFTDLSFYKPYAVKVFRSGAS